VTALHPAEDATPRRRGRPPNSDSEQTKLRVLEAAIDAFAADGFSGASSRVIAQGAGVSPATVYHHFVNKRQLYAAAFQHSVDIAWTEYGEAALSGETLLDELMAVVRRAIRVMQERPSMVLLAIRAAIDLGRDIDTTIPSGVSAAMAARAVARGELRPDDVPYIRPLLEMLLWGVSVVGRDSRGVQRRCETALDLLVHQRLVQRPPRRRRTG
jgi:AcrR family transcriptional regulator